MAPLFFPKSVTTCQSALFPISHSFMSSWILSPHPPPPSHSSSLTSLSSPHTLSLSYLPQSGHFYPVPPLPLLSLSLSSCSFLSPSVFSPVGETDGKEVCNEMAISSTLPKLTWNEWSHWSARSEAVQMKKQEGGWEGKLSFLNVEHILLILLSDRMSAQSLQTTLYVCVFVLPVSCMWNSRCVQKISFFFFLGLKSIVGQSVISAEGRSDLHSREFPCCLKREQRGRQARKQLKRVKIRKTLTNRRRQNDSTHFPKSLKLFLRGFFYIKNVRLYHSEAILWN